MRQVLTCPKCKKQYETYDHYFAVKTPQCQACYEESQEKSSKKSNGKKRGMNGNDTPWRKFRHGGFS
jgi:uncharacterized Zn ribbon protein